MYRELFSHKPGERFVYSKKPMNKFEEDKFYVMSSPGVNWCDFDGPFDSQDEAVAHLKLFINERHTHSPEMLKMVVVHFKDSILDLVKVDDHPLNGEWKSG